MKKLILLFLLIFVPIICLGQGNFRKMYWGESEADLNRVYSDINFSKTNEDEYGLVEFNHSEELSGIRTSISYLFYNDSLVGGYYNFRKMDFYADNNQRLKDFNRIQERLYEKYPKDIYNWEEITDVEDTRRFMRLDYKELDGTLIRHKLGYDKINGHNLFYSNYRFREIINEFNQRELNNF